jgi:hypothetical protein
MTLVSRHTSTGEAPQCHAAHSSWAWPRGRSAHVGCGAVPTTERSRAGGRAPGWPVNRTSTTRPAVPAPRSLDACSAAAARWRAGRVRAAASLAGHAAAVTVIHALGDTAVTASNDGTARVWHLGTVPRQLCLLPHSGAPVVAAALLSPDLAVTATAAAAHLWRGGRRVRSFAVQSPVRWSRHRSGRGRAVPS